MPVADCLEEAGDRLFHPFSPSQYKSIRTSNAIERLQEEFKRRIKSQTRLPCTETAASVRLRPDPHAQGRRMAEPGREPSNHIIDLAA